MSKDSRYPYTYACDYLRGFGGYGDGGVKMSRCDASLIRDAVAKAIGMSDKELAEKLADYYLANEDEINEKSTKCLIASLNVHTSTEPA